MMEQAILGSISSADGEKIMDIERS